MATSITPTAHIATIMVHSTSPEVAPRGDADVTPSRALVDALDPTVRAKYLELWELAQLPDPMPE
jgi:hypothetical protein